MSRRNFLTLFSMDKNLMKKQEELFLLEVEQLELHELSSVLGGYEGSGGDCKNKSCVSAGNGCANDEC